ncbi:MAG: hypothetical protein NXH78_01990 [Hyphomonadaceae bacterium]|nr:hypothetical protein [Hyphomonadaceae bacterium]
MSNESLIDVPGLHSAKIFASSSSKETAHEIAALLARRGWSTDTVITSSHTSQLSKNKYPERDVSANIALMDEKLYNESRVLFNQIGVFCENNFQNIFIISLDKEWQKAKNDNTKKIFSRSFVSSYNPEIIDGLAARIEKKAMHSSRAFSASVFA